LVLAGVAFFSKSGADWIDRQTGTGIGSTLNNAKDTSWSWIKDKLGIAPEPPPPSARTDDFSKNRAVAMAAGTAVPPALAAVRATPAVVVAGADATKLGAQKIASLIPEGAGGMFTPFTQAARDVGSLVNPFRPVSDAAVAASTANAAVNASKLTSNAAASGAESMSAIGAKLAGKTAPAFKVAARAAGPLGAAVGVGMDGYHAGNLVGEGKIGSAVAQTVGTGIETVGFFTGPVGVAVGSVGKEVIGTVDNLVTDNRNVTRSAIGGAMDMIPGVTAAQDAVSVGMVRAVQAPADAWNYITGNTDDAIMRENIAKRTAERISQLSGVDKEKFDKVKSAMLNTPTFNNKPGFDVDNAALIAVTSDNIPVEIAGALDQPRHGLTASTNNRPQDKGKS